MDNIVPTKSRIIVIIYYFFGISFEYYYIIFIIIVIIIVDLYIYTATAATAEVVGGGVTDSLSLEADQGCHRDHSCDRALSAKNSIACSDCRTENANLHRDRLTSFLCHVDIP